MPAGSLSPRLMAKSISTGAKTMMDGMMNGGAMMWGMALIGLLVIVLLGFGIAALVKYLFKK
jgi:threonine/homoserine/homoserine lactone efflux protein